MRLSRPPALALLAALLVPGPARAWLPAFEADSPWTRDVSGAPLDPDSDAIIAWLRASGGGFGLGRMQVDFSIEVMEARSDTLLQPFQPTGDFFTPDCDLVPVPVPLGGALEGESGYACESGGDCHLIVHHTPSSRLFEMWRADIRDGVFRGGCLAVWDLARPYGDGGRGAGCTSADAAGLPIAPLLFDADEVASGEIRHAIRFVLPNTRIRNRHYLPPATHATDVARGGALAPPYGARLRLRADYPMDRLRTPGARVVARALQRYGMLLADGGLVALTARSDRFTEARWEGLLGPHDLRFLTIGDFEVVDSGPPRFWDGTCTRRDAVPQAPAISPPPPPPTLAPLPRP